MCNVGNRGTSQKNPCAHITTPKCFGQAPCCCPRKPTKDHRDMCGRQNRISTSAGIVENVLDIGATLVRVLINCGVHECKAYKALDVIIYSFMFFEEVREHPNRKCKRRIRKKEFMDDLMGNCDMTRTEARMTYAITKASFKAFYNQKLVTRHDANAIAPCEWRQAVEKTVEAFNQTGATESEVQIIGKRICSAYTDYLNRRQTRKKLRHICQQECSQAEENPPCFFQPIENLMASQKPVLQGVIPCQPCQPCQQQNDQSFKMFCHSWLESDSSAHDELKLKLKDANLEGKLIGEYYMPLKSGCNDSACNPVMVKDCLGRTYLMIQGNQVYFDPTILIHEAQRINMDLKLQSGAEEK